jgi:hypothetical protein
MPDAVKRLCKSFYRRNDLQNRFTENPQSADYASGKNIKESDLSVKKINPG